MAIAGKISTITLPSGLEYELGGSGDVDTGIIAEDYDSTASYAVGDYCSHESKIYRATTPISGEAWNSSHWAEVVVMNEITARCSILPAAGVSF